jgi:hypothetical protein
VLTEALKAPAVLSFFFLFCITHRRFNLFESWIVDLQLENNKL